MTKKTTKEFHGLTKTVEYDAWCNLRIRCNNPKKDTFAVYGGRGIKVDPAWDSFLTFLRDMGPRPSPKHSIDRIDVNGPYCKDNCRWATIPEQSNNRRSTKWVTWNGKTQTLTQWAEEFGVSSESMSYRFRKGWSTKDMMTKPFRQYNSSKV